MSNYKPVPALVDHNVARVKRHRVAVRTESGKVRHAPALPHEEWCKASGNVHRIAMMTTRNTREAIDVNAYRDLQRRRGIRKGWFPWNYNDAKAIMPIITGINGETVNVASMTPEQWDKWKHEEQKRRQDRHAEQGKDFDRAWRTAREVRGEEAREDIAAAFKDMIEHLRAEKPKKVDKGQP